MGVGGVGGEGVGGGCAWEKGVDDSVMPVS